MNQEIRKDYNRVYYEKNKIKILEKHAVKVQCEFCLRKTTNLNKHQKTPICARFQLKNIEMKKRRDNIIV
jgi:hypothetical protein